MYFLRRNLSNITYEDLNLTEVNNTDYYNYDDEILTWADWFASWFWY